MFSNIWQLHLGRAQTKDWVALIYFDPDLSLIDLASISMTCCAFSCSNRFLNRREGWLRVSPRIPQPQWWAVYPRCKVLLCTARYAKARSLILSLEYLFWTPLSANASQVRIEMLDCFLSGQISETTWVNPQRVEYWTYLACVDQSLAYCAINHFFYLNNEIIGRGYFLFPPWIEAEKEEKVDPKPRLRCNCGMAYVGTVLLQKR